MPVILRKSMRIGTEIRIHRPGAVVRRKVAKYPKLVDRDIGEINVNRGQG